MLTVTDTQTSPTTQRSSFVFSIPEELLNSYTIKVPTGHGLFPILLTTRETEILTLLGKGLSMKGTARELSISPGTVKWHMKNAYLKLDAHSREDALSKARHLQFIRQ